MIKAQISNSKVENVVNAPKNPTIIAKRKFSFIVNLSVSKIRKKPMRNEPKMLMINVGKGNFSKTFESGEMLSK